MKYFSQHDPKFKKIKLGTCNDSIYNSGCFLVSIANLTDNDPEFLNEMFKTTGVYSNGCMINAEKAASRLGYTYKRLNNNPKVKCIAETDHYKSKGVPQHFFLLKPDESIIDPLDYPVEFKQNQYHIVSYRVFTKIDIGEAPENKRIIDLSHHNRVTDWSKLKDDFIIHKCTQGINYIDPTYNDRKDKIQASYHFAGKTFLDGNGKPYYIPQDPIKEADWYIKNIGNEKYLILDFEVYHTDPAGWCKKFIDRVREKTGIQCWLYTNDARACKYFQDFQDTVFWIARYADYTGKYYPDFTPKFKNWSIHQYTSRGRVDGIEGNVDLNIATQLFQEKLKNEPVSKEKPDPLPEPKEGTETPEISITEEIKPIEECNKSISSLVILILKKLIEWIKRST